MSTMIQLKNVFKSFQVLSQQVEVLKDISFSVTQGDFLIIVGPSGCGKSTLLHTILGLEFPSAGDVFFMGKDLYKDTSEDERSDIRKKHVGMIFQQPNWIKALNVTENVAFPLSLVGKRSSEALQKAYDLLKTVGMENWANYLPTELSSGQQQKIALARGLITNPSLIVADEPTGNLDFASGQELMELLVMLNKNGKTVIMVTHDLEYLSFAKTVLEMRDGKVEGVYHDDEKRTLTTKVKLKRGKDKKKEVNL